MRRGCFLLVGSSLVSCLVWVLLRWGVPDRLRPGRRGKEPGGFEDALLPVFGGDKFESA